MADRLRASTGRFFFGDRPSSLDALLFGHLAFYRHSPVAAPVLREKVCDCFARAVCALLQCPTLVKQPVAALDRCTQPAWT